MARTNHRYPNALQHLADDCSECRGMVCTGFQRNFCGAIGTDDRSGNRFELSHRAEVAEGSEAGSPE